MPTFGNGKICYIEIPATDVARSADFYKTLLRWKIRQRGVGSVAGGNVPSLYRHRG